MRFAPTAGKLVLLAVLAGGFPTFRLNRPYQGFHDAVFVDIPRGASTYTIAGMLADAGVVPSRWDFLLARLVKRGRVLQAGEYRFNQPASPVEVLDRLARGDIFFYELVVPEGKNIFEIAASVEDLGLFKASQFLAAARNPKLIRDLDPLAPSLEGYLYPDTYRLSRHTTPDDLCRRMTTKFREAWATSRMPNEDVHKTVTLASLVEKESKLPEDRFKIAAVFKNRLRIGMKLDCDPTAIYAALLEGRYHGVIHRSDLDSDDPYNTYRHSGLPPGPIASPSLASIRAVEAPAHIDALYFVLRPGGSGAHEFSSNSAAHEAAAARFRRARKK
ncbi:MAG TPA: endolytic transglycosylase MltG [Bryobacteraceae bacterium]|nr:endolytic transglycosylase MltG [Bryobacteraceae bacterium]